MARIALCLSALLVTILLVQAIYQGDAKPEYTAILIMLSPIPLYAALLYSKLVIYTRMTKRALIVEISKNNINIRKIGHNIDVNVQSKFSSRCNLVASHTDLLAGFKQAFHQINEITSEHWFHMRPIVIVRLPEKQLSRIKLKYINDTAFEAGAFDVLQAKSAESESSIRRKLRNYINQMCVYGK
ncbi:hypothetical protein AN214_03907 [Pseudoalteromonas sp. P1-9]|uniref:hypothetical protein n=1 Tax=Pseudoalteromonas sp. P1-9 TaxID=1710354 RepID=UPI00070843CE|nr:hypothetical protein [Pseudoalteromonas sp. P1-9]KPV94074.1 hypothetical protein AN214_03907 [Pseudoalteromonas sp. P1-9]